ncbi:MAG TPA: hypothetical protein VFU01_02895 [Gemmatimonadaceae bacterium]|nr:hypothetical protein [Gemmatimonadaceae bacterium]
MTYQELVAEELDAEFRAADERLDALRAKAEAARAEKETDEISRLWPIKERVERKLSELRRSALARLAARRKEAEKAVHDFESKIDRAAERFSSLDAPGERPVSDQVQDTQA